MQQYLKLVHDKTPYIPQKPKMHYKSRKNKKIAPKFKRTNEVKHPPREALPIPASETDLCRSLWQSVIIQALYDVGTDWKTHEHNHVRAEALAWFGQGAGKHRTNDFEMVCDLAEMDLKLVQKLAKKVRDDGINVLEGFNFRTMRKETSLRKGKK